MSVVGRLMLPARRCCRPSAAAWMVLAGVVLLSCGTGATNTRGAAALHQEDMEKLAGSVTVFAAASLTEAFTSLGEEFERLHPATKVVFNFAGAPILVNQIRQGAPVDVFASADQANMDRVVREVKIVGSPQIFANNLLKIVVAAGNPHKLAGLEDLSRSGLVVALCQSSVPAGHYAVETFGKAGIPVPAGPREENVKAVVNKVALGEVDAGIVYATDVLAATSKVTGIDIPPAHNVVAGYPIVALHEAANPALAQAFVHFAVSVHGQAVMQRFGFLSP